jgi:adenylate kinase family enzyme
MKRIMIIGASGSGKSTLARKLGSKLNLPVVHGDHFYFNAGWKQKSREETITLFDQAAARETWIIEGNNGSSMENRAKRADVIIYLELGKWHRLRRTLWRTVKSYGRSRPDVPSDCRERLDFKFHFDWVLGFDKRSKAKMEWFVAQWSERKPMVILSSAKEVAAFLEDPTQAIEAACPS